jgi:hypothetical protein
MKEEVFHDLLSSGLRGSQSATWRWKSSPFTSLDRMLGWLHLYHCVPREHIRVFLFSSPEHMEAMLRWENQGLLSIGITVEQLWDKYRVSWIEVRRLEIELGAGGDHDQVYAWSLPPSIPHALAWTKLRTLREYGVYES